jgi:selenocysteine lyase/cysteine desulfurase
MLSSVSFLSSEIVPELASLAAACDKKEIPLFIDVYHQLGVAPFSLAGLQNAYVTGGGYKYCQLGEGNCFLRFPKTSRLRPLVTGWYAEFDLLGEAPAMALTEYPEGPGRFAGATYDPVSHYRAAAVFDFFQREGLTPALLREVSQHQIGRLCHAFDALQLPPALIDRDRSLALGSLAGFLALRTSKTAVLVEKLRAGGVDVDARGEVLRFGPAPYLSDRQLDDAMAILGEVAKTLE